MVTLRITDEQGTRVTEAMFPETAQRMSNMLLALGSEVTVAEVV